ncbi:MAG: hypothetical protein II822_06715 [Prevotella sp.]|nr:hypothetical protein [Prevotella sp.]
MKSKKLLVAAVLMLTATAALAQQHIQEAFDALRQDKVQKEIWSKHSVEKDPDTGLMEGLEDTYDFLIVEPSRRRLVENIQKAFRQDEGKAYSVSSGTHGNAENFVSLAVGDSNKGGVAIGLMNGSNWIYACFLDPDDSLRRYRYAYALEWVDDGDKLRGRIAKTYATTQKYRQGNATSRRAITLNGNALQVLEGLGSSFSFSTSEKSSETWLTEFNTYKNLFLRHPEGTAANSYVTQIYKLCKDAKSLEDVEKNMIATEIEKLKKKTKDEFIQQLFDMSIERLKK